MAAPLPKSGAATAKRKAELADWERQYGKLVDLTAFEREILPLIREVPLSQLVKTTGLSLRYILQIRRGKRVPHPRHWAALLAAAGVRRSAAARRRGRTV
jgi:hypothetical protein